MVVIENMDYLIRKADLSDAQSLAKIQSESWSAAYKDIAPVEELAKFSKIECWLERFQSMLVNPIGEYYIAFHGEAPCGAMVYSQTRDSDLPEYAEIVSMYATPPYWNKGLGRAMMEKALYEIQLNEYKCILLWVLKENNRARKFYEKFGFVADGAEKESHLSNRAKLVRYRLKIRSDGEAGSES